MANGVHADWEGGLDSADDLAAGRGSGSGRIGRALLGGRLQGL